MHSLWLLTQKAHRLEQFDMIQGTISDKFPDNDFMILPNVLGCAGSHSGSDSGSGSGSGCGVSNFWAKISDLVGPKKWLNLEGIVMQWDFACIMHKSNSFVNL